MKLMNSYHNKNSNTLTFVKLQSNDMKLG